MDHISNPFCVFFSQKYSLCEDDWSVCTEKKVLGDFPQKSKLAVLGLKNPLMGGNFSKLQVVFYL